MEESEMEGISGPIGELIKEIAVKCEVMNNAGFFLSKKKIAFLAIVALTGKIIYGDGKNKCGKNDKYYKVIDQLKEDLMVKNEAVKEIIDTIVEEIIRRKYTMDEYARQIFEIFAGDEEILKSIMELLIIIIIIKVGVPEEEDNYLRKIAKIFRINELEYFNLKNNCIKRGERRGILEVSQILGRDISDVCSCESFFSKNESEIFEIKNRNSGGEKNEN